MTATPTPSRVHLTLALIKAALGIGGLLLVVVLIVMAVVGGHDKAGATKADGGAYLACSHAAGVFDDWQSTRTPASPPSRGSRRTRRPCSQQRPRTTTPATSWPHLRSSMPATSSPRSS